MFCLGLLLALIFIKMFVVDGFFNLGFSHSGLDPEHQLH